LSREILASVFEDITSNKDAALEKSLKDLPDNFPVELFESIATALQRRLPKLQV